MTALPPGWQWTTLDELQADEPRAITDGPFGSNLTSAHYTQSGARVVRLQNIGDGVFNDAAAYISSEHFESLKSHEVKAGDLLVASLGDVLPKACLAPATLGPAIVKADCIRVRLSASVEPRWVLYAMQTSHARSWAKDQLHGVGRLRLGLKAIRQIPVPLPPIEEQRRIVEILEDHLSRLDAGVRGLDAARKRLVSLFRSFVTSLIPAETPAGWNESRLDEVADVRLGRQRSPSNHSGPNMRPYLRAANVGWNGLQLDDVKEMNFEDREMQAYRLQPGDILLSEASGSPGEVGKPALWNGEISDCAFQNTLLRVRPHSADPRFLLHFLRHQALTGAFAKHSRGVGIHHIGREKLAAWLVPVPPIEEQRRIANLVDSMTADVARFEAQLKSSERTHVALRRALLRAAFEGRLTSRVSTVEEVLAGVR